MVPFMLWLGLSRMKVSLGCTVAFGPTFVSDLVRHGSRASRAMLNRTWLCSLVKVAPSIATSFFTYELVKERILARP